MAEFNPNTLAFIQAHTAPFNSPDQWGGHLPRIPDGAQEATQVQQIRFQTQFTTDANGAFHIVIPGDPFAHRFPIIDSTMNNGPAPTLPLPTIVNLEAQTTAGSTQGEFTTWLKDVLQNSLEPYQSGPYVNYYQQLGDLVKNNAKYRIVGQASRVWSLLGEVATTQGIIRGAPLDPTMLECAWETRGPIGGTVLLKAQAPTSYPPDLSASRWSGNSVVPYASLTASPSAYSTDSVYGGFMVNCLAANVSLANQYLKQTTEASEDAFAYKIFPGQDGCTIRSKYLKPEIPFKRLRPRNLIFDASQATMPGGDGFTGVQATESGILEMSQFSAPYTNFATTFLLTGTPVPLLVPDATTSSYIPVVVGGDYGGYKSQTQSTSVVGLDEQISGVCEAVRAEDHDLTGYHFEMSAFPPNSQLFFEHVLTVEVVPIQQQNGLMSTDVMPDTNFSRILEVIADTESFPVVVKGHSFWKTLGKAFNGALNAVGKIAQTATKVSALGLAAKDAWNGDMTALSQEVAKQEMRQSRRIKRSRLEDRY